MIHPRGHQFVERSLSDVWVEQLSLSLHQIVGTGNVKAGQYHVGQGYLEKISDCVIVMVGLRMLTDTCSLSNDQ